MATMYQVNVAPPPSEFQHNLACFGSVRDSDHDGVLRVFPKWYTDIFFPYHKCNQKYNHNTTIFPGN